ncbi:MAG: MFS transporter [bacterium]|nr:MFS transporter [bacterium]
MRETQKKPFYTMLVTIFFDMLGYGILIPVIPILLGDPTSADFILPAGFTLKQGYIMLGILLGVQPLMQFFSAPILGQLSDKYGRKKILFISMLGTCLSYILFAIAIMTKDINLLFASRILDGITGGNISVANAAVSDITPIKDRTKNYGMMGAAFGLGFIIGPFIGGQLSDPSVVSWFSASTPFWFAVILTLINLALVVFIFPETNTNINHRHEMTWFQSVGHIKKAFLIKNLRSLFSSTFTYYAGFSFFTTFFTIFLIQKLHFDQGDIGFFFAYVGIWLIFTQLVIVRFLLKDIPERFILPLAMAAAGAGVFALLSVSTTAMLLVVIPFFAIANGITLVNMTSLVSKSATKDVQGEIFGISASVQALAQSVPPILSGFIAYMLNPDSPIFVSATFMIVASIIFIAFYRRQKTVEEVFS